MKKLSEPPQSNEQFAILCVAVYFLQSLLTNYKHNPLPGVQEHPPQKTACKPPQGSSQPSTAAKGTVLVLSGPETRPTDRRTKRAPRSEGASPQRGAAEVPKTGTSATWSSGPLNFQSCLRPCLGVAPAIEERKGGGLVFRKRNEREKGIERAWVGVRLSMSVDLEGCLSCGFGLLQLLQASNKGFCESYHEVR